MLLFVSLPTLKRADGPRARRSSLACLCCQGGAVMGLVGGLLTALSGSLLTGISWLVSDAGLAAALHQIGGVLLCATIPLLMLGAFCLDGVASKTTKQQH